MDSTNIHEVSAESAENKMASVAFDGRIQFINGFLTFMFGFTFAGSVLPIGWQFLSGCVGGAMYVAFLDYAARSWDKKLKQQGLSPEQIVIAKESRMIGLVCSTIVSVLYIVLSTTLIDLSEYNDYVGFGALAVITFVGASNFWNVYKFSNESLEAQEAAIIAAHTASSRKVDMQSQQKLNNIRLKEKMRMTSMIGDLVSQEINGGMRKIAHAEAKKILGEWDNEWNLIEETDITEDADGLDLKVAEPIDEAKSTPPSGEKEPFEIQLEEDYPVGK